MKEEKSLFTVTIRELAELEPKEFSELAVQSGWLGPEIKDINQFLGFDVKEAEPERFWKKRCRCKEYSLIAKKTKKKKP